MDGVVEAVVLADDREIVQLVQHSDPFKDGSPATMAPQSEANEEAEGGDAETPAGKPDLSDLTLFALGILVTVVVQGLSQTHSIDQERNEEDTCGHSMDLSPSGLVEDADQGKGDGAYNAEAEEDVVLGVGGLTVELLIEGAQVGLLHGEHVDGHHQDEGAGVHLLVDHITDHRPVRDVALVPQGLVGAGVPAHQAQGNGHSPAEEYGQVLQGEGDHAILGEEPRGERGDCLNMGFGCDG